MLQILWPIGLAFISLFGVCKVLMTSLGVSLMRFRFLIFRVDFYLYFFLCFCTFALLSLIFVIFGFGGQVFVLIFMYFDLLFYITDNSRGLA